MYDKDTDNVNIDIDDFNGDVIDYSNCDEFSYCNSCPYFSRQFPPQLPPFIGPPPYQGDGMGIYPPEPSYGSPPFTDGHMGGAHQGPPHSPPPSITPYKSNVNIKAVSPGSIRPCTYRYVYMWLQNGKSFWAWLTRVDRRSASGFRWRNRRWVYFGVDLREIESFECY